MRRTGNFGTDFWNDSCDYKELSEAIKHGAVGATSNPVIVCTVVKNNSTYYGPIIDAIAQNNPFYSEVDIAWQLIGTIVAEAAELLEPIFTKTNGKKGRLSVQVNPIHYRDPDAMIEHGKTLDETAPNLAIKLPATHAGCTAVRELTSKGTSVTATVSFSVAQAIHCAEAIEEGLKQAEARGLDIDHISPSVVIMVGRLDDHLKRRMTSKGITVDPGILEWAGIAVFKKLYALFTERGYRSRLLAAAYRNHMHWSQFIGGDVTLTIPYKHWRRFNASSVEVIPRMNEPVDPGIIKNLCEHFSDFKRAYHEQGLQPEEFEYFGPSVHTLHQFINGYYDLLTLVRSRMLP
jgi:transaldolase